jgi:hypothetical protein
VICARRLSSEADVGTPRKIREYIASGKIEKYPSAKIEDDSFPNSFTPICALHARKTTSIAVWQMQGTQSFPAQAETSRVDRCAAQTWQMPVIFRPLPRKKYQIYRRAHMENAYNF